MRRRDFIRTGTISGVLAGSGAFAASAHPLAALAAPGRRTADGDVRLNSNENPLGISPRARETLVEAITLANRYPSAQHGALVSRLAAAHGVGDNQVVLGTGSAEVLQMVVQAFAAPRAKLVMADPTYEAVTNYQRTESYETDQGAPHEQLRARPRPHAGGGRELGPPPRWSTSATPTTRPRR